MTPARTLGTLLRNLSETLDRAVEEAYRDAGLSYRPRYTPVFRALLSAGTFSGTSDASGALVMTAPGGPDRRYTDPYATAPVEKAFTTFTESFDTWWPRSHHIGTVEMAEAIIEPRVEVV